MILIYFDTIFIVEYSHCGLKKIRADGKEHRIEKAPRAQCQAVLTCTVAFSIVEKILDEKYAYNYVCIHFSWIPSSN